MCTRKKPLGAKQPKDFSKGWRIPKQIREAQMTLGQILVRCGKCYECKKELARNWTYKVFLEAMGCQRRCFLTLTYADAPKSVVKKHLQDFIKRLRKKTGATFKYYGVGEYGETRTQRPHYHLIVLGWQPKDLKPVHSAKSKKGHSMYFSDFVKDTWGLGRITVQRFHPNEVGYITLYTNKNDDIRKQTKMMKKELIHELKAVMGITSLIDTPPTVRKLYKRRYRQNVKWIDSNIEVDEREPEFNVWSNGIGWGVFLEKGYYKSDLVINGYVYEIPREFIRKVFDIKRELPRDVIESIYKVQKKRVEVAEIQYDEIMAMSMDELRSKERARDEQNKNSIRLNKKFANGF